MSSRSGRDEARRNGGRDEEGARHGDHLPRQRTPVSAGPRRPHHRGDQERGPTRLRPRRGRRLHLASELKAPFCLGEVSLLRELFESAGIPNAKVETVAGTARFPSIDSWVHTDVRGWTLDNASDINDVRSPREHRRCSGRRRVRSVRGRIPGEWVLAHVQLGADQRARTADRRPRRSRPPVSSSPSVSRMLRKPRRPHGVGVRAVGERVEIGGLHREAGQGKHSKALERSSGGASLWTRYSPDAKPK